MSFLAPLMLFGAAAAAIPIAIHFFFRTRYRKVAWAAMDFLLQSIEQTSRRVKFQEYLLLLSRILVIVFFALALAQVTNLAPAGFYWLLGPAVLGVVTLTWVLSPLWKLTSSFGTNLVLFGVSQFVLLAISA